MIKNILKRREESNTYLSYPCFENVETKLKALSLILTVPQKRKRKRQRGEKKKKKKVYYRPGYHCLLTEFPPLFSSFLIPNFLNPADSSLDLQHCLEFVFEAMFDPFYILK